MRKEEIILSALTKDFDFAKKVIPYIQPEFFQDQKERVTYSLIEKFFTQYGKLPTRDIMRLQLEELDSVQESDFDDTKQVLDSAFKDVYEYDEKWLIDETERFCKDRAVYNAIMQAVLIINGDDKKHTEGQIPGLLQNALSISFDHAIGHDYFNDAENRFRFYSQTEQRIACSIDLLNKATNGGIPRKTLNMFVAQPKGGKSLAMCSLAADYLRLGLNVLYITLELAEERVAERIDANLFNVDIQNIKTLEHDVFINKIENIKAKTHGRLKIKEYPTKTASATNFKVLIDDLILREEFTPDIVFVDYLGICASSQYKNAPNINSYTYQKAVSEELRALAVEYNLIMWTALQTNRTGYNTSDFDIDSISDSSGPIMTCDFAAGLIRTPELDELNQMLIKQLASRYGDPDLLKRFVVGVDRSKMKLYNVDISVQSTLTPDVDTRSTRKRENKPALNRDTRDETTPTKTKKLDADEWDFGE